MNIQEIRQKYPDYKDLSDTELAQGLHKKFYSDIPFDQFSQKIGLSQEFNIRDVNVQDYVAQQAGEAPPQRPGPQQAEPLTPAMDVAKQFFPPRPGDISPENQSMLMATAATLAAPQLAIPARAAQAMGPYISQVASQALKIPAAFLGGATGRATGEIQKDPNAEVSDIILDSLRSGGEMAAAETTGAMLGPLVSKIFAPGAASLTDDAQGLIRFAKEKKIPFAPSSMSGNVTAKVAEGGADAFFPSRLMNDHYRKKAVIRFNQLMTEIPEEVGKIEGNRVITPKALGEIDEFLKQSKSAGKELSEGFIESVGRDTKVKVSNTTELFNRIKRTATDESLLKWIATKSQQFKGKQIPAEELEEALRQVGGIKPKTDKKWLEEIRNAIKADFEKAGAPMEQLAASNKAFGENYAITGKKFTRELSDAIARGEEPTGLTVKIFRNGNEGFLSALSNESGKKGGKITKETWDSLRAQNLQNMIQNASTESKRLMGLRVIDGNKLEKILDANSKALEVAYKDNPKVLTAMRNLARLAKSTSQDLSTFEKGFSDSFKVGNMSTAVAGFYQEPAGLLLGTATAPLLAKSIMNQNGWMNKWLTTGFDPKLGQEALKLGGRAVFSGSTDAEDDSLPD